MVRFKVEINGYFVENINNIPEIITLSVWYAYELDAFDTLIFQGLSAYRYGWRYLLFVVFLIFEVVK